MNTTDFDRFFLNNSEAGLQSFQDIVSETQRVLSDFYKNNTDAFNGKQPHGIAEELNAVPLASKDGEDFSKVLEDVSENIVKNSIHVSHPTSIGHLHCPPLVPAIAAELLIGALNQSMDSWDQSSSATYLEEKLIHWVKGKLDLPKQADGTFTSGGTQSNYMGLLLARDDYCDKVWNWNVKVKGLPPEAHKMRILCSEDAHFTVKKSAFQLGLGEQAVISIETDQNKKMNLSAVEAEIQRLKSEGLYPMCVVATAGTTDFGSIDPIEDLSVIAEKNGLWMHVDAAYGGALMLSKKHSHKLTGIQHADSITIDFHKQFYQPISCGAFFVKNQESFRYLAHHADYLNPENDEDDGLVHLVSKSVQTTRRFDALKLFMSLRIVGENHFANMIDYTLHLAKQAAGVLNQKEHFEICNKKPEINAVVFRYRDSADETLDELNMYIYKRILHTGTALVAKTKVNGQVFLKFTLLNPRTTIVDIEDILYSISQFAAEYENRGITQ
ncbi:pyridoxal phosphate-dependent decarboxylase family protein [Fictibacillus phosphorivorans]|uniref:pyridoxal phosphate-dependent decarboxylase family protein n=1 Tax=Fictibacillus phosphorivorans TaxID=1221500 RepID=UPI00203F9DBD|nr:aspartate aminotransferase family protein [Fictibacillus phosphorivorans]MCM3720026.1 aspartate aminotransferase family protein [Fictibacillus phosphorivorans]MCM3777704.1 aspartate aminotransferase family protein [Fictibacillus phosphorivorans]